MEKPYHYLEVTQRAGVYCIRLLRRQIPETDIHDMAEELFDVATAGPGRKVALSLGPKPPECLYSVFLSKLIALQRVNGEKGGVLVLCDVGPVVHAIFEACKLDGQFRFVADFDEAVAVLTKPPVDPEHNGRKEAEA